jgi:hypothetical protein
MFESGVKTPITFVILLDTLFDSQKSKYMTDTERPVYREISSTDLF